jgi:hypothetical protein
MAVDESPQPPFEAGVEGLRPPFERVVEFF